MASSGQRLPPHEIAQKLFDEEALRQILSSLVVCYFARGVYTTNIVSKYFKAIGVDATVDALSQMGRDLKGEVCIQIQRSFSLDRDQLRIPKRVIEQPTPLGMITEEEIRDGVAAFKKN